MSDKLKTKQIVYGLNDGKDIDGKEWCEGELPDTELVGESEKE